MPNCGFPKPGTSFISREKWGSTDRLCQAVAFRSLENALFLKKTGGQQIGCANLWLSAAWKMLYFSGKGGGQQIDCAKMWLSEAWKMLISREKRGSTDRLCQTVAFRSLDNALFLGKSGGQQIGCAKLWLSEAWKMLYFSGKVGVNR